MKLKLICFLVSTRISSKWTYLRPGYKILPEGLTGKKEGNGSPELMIRAMVAGPR